MCGRVSAVFFSIVKVSDWFQAESYILPSRGGSNIDATKKVGGNRTWNWVATGSINACDSQPRCASHSFMFFTLVEVSESTGGL